nr:MAG TPA: hypothetical protein [Caudoviricetes sp.]
MLTRGSGAIRLRSPRGTERTAHHPAIMQDQRKHIEQNHIKP